MKEIYADIEQRQALYRFKDTHKERYMLRFDHADGRMTCIEYNHLAMVEFANDSVIINYIHTTMKITGQNLRKLGIAIGRREAGKIIEQHTNPEGLSAGEMFIEIIEISDR